MNDNYLLIPSGEYDQGSPKTPEELYAKYGGAVQWYEDVPFRRVKIERPFFLSKFPVTVGEFSAFADATGYKTNAEQFGGAYGSHKNVWFYEMGLNWRRPGFPQTARHPVACVSAVDAEAYIAWLNETTGEKYRLPSEAEWEYACRAGSQSEFFWGDDLEDGAPYLNGADEAGTSDGETWFMKFPFNNGYAGTSPVGKFLPNAFGLYDMLGNVWEWCSDVFPPDKKGKTRVVRGGSWRTPPQRCRCAFRNPDQADAVFVSHGFRLAKDAD